MGICRTRFGVLLYLPLCLIHFLSITHSYMIANPSTSWINSPSSPDSMNFSLGLTVTIILPRELGDLASSEFACGFICNHTRESSYFFGIFIPNYKNPQVVWSANQNNPVKIGATLQLTSTGGLVLQDANGTTAWSTNISSKVVTALDLTNEGNLVLLDENNATIWQSFDHPTDSLLLGQKLKVGQKLTSSDGGLFSLSVTSKGLSAFVESNPPQVYFAFPVFNGNAGYVKYQNRNFSFFTHEGKSLDFHYEIPQSPSLQYMRLDPDGHLRVYLWEMSGSKEVTDLLTGYVGNCGYPTVCGNYGICTNGTNDQCMCPPTSTNGTTYFKPIDGGRLDRGCSLITPFSCDSKKHKFLMLENVVYFSFYEDLRNVSSESCRTACLKNCSCKAAIFRYHYSSFISGDCYLPSQIFSLGNYEKGFYNYTTYLKVQMQMQNVQKQSNRVGVILGSSLASLFGLFLFIVVLFLLCWKNRDADDEAEEHFLDQVPGMPNRHSYEDLKVATENFNKKLGGGGFGSVFEGTLIDGTKVAVKLLDGFGQIKKSFLAEVETIGSIHHFNLVRLIGFCAEKSHRLLVYEYMCNGSLDKWIFRKNNGLTLDWHQRKKIITDTAKGLAYLHEDCRQRIVHLDVKPGNILLDENFNAKVSDFGLSKLIDRDQSQVVTTMRGTPGYLAPEWQLGSGITEKVDVYSFGVMTLEILCGRRIFDRSQPEEAMNLLKLFQRKAEEEQLLDLFDKHIENIQLHGEEILYIMKVAAWCLQFDFAKRPSMSVVVKVLEGIMDVEHNLDYNFSNRPLPNTRAGDIHHEVNTANSTPPLPSLLSGPR